jgi:hypothetical protein
VRVKLGTWAAVLAVLAGNTAQAAENPLPSFSGGKPGSACFRRDYDAAHLRRHQGQRTTSIMASVSYNSDMGGATLRLRLVQKGLKAAADVYAGCDWSETANRDTSGNVLLPVYPREDGFVCIVIADSGSAEELGTVMFDLPVDGRKLTVYADDAIGLWSATNPKPGQPMLKLGAEDRVFRLDPADPSACRDLDRDLN